MVDYNLRLRWRNPRCTFMGRRVGLGTCRRRATRIIPLSMLEDRWEEGGFKFQVQAFQSYRTHDTS